MTTKKTDEKAPAPKEAPTEAPPATETTTPAPPATAEPGDVLRTTATTPGKASAASLSDADRKRQQELAASGYRIPDALFANARVTEEREKAIAKRMPSTDGSKPHKP